MPESGPYSVDHSISPTVIHSVSQDSSLFPFPRRCLNVYEQTSVSAPGSSNSIAPHSSTLFSSTNHVDSSSVSSVTSATSATSTFTANQELDASSSISSSPASRTQVPLSTFATTPHPAILAQHGSLTPLGSASSTSITQSEYAAYDFSTVSSMYSLAPYLTPASAASGASSIWATFSTDHWDHCTGTSGSDLALQPTPTGVLTSTPASVSSVVTGTTISLQR